MKQQLQYTCYILVIIIYINYMEEFDDYINLSVFPSLSISV